jgi:predicted transposase/invertase (TIGR01784 family)
MKKSLKYYRDLKNSLDTAKEEGIIEGIEKEMKKEKIEGKIEIAKNGLKEGLSLEIIMKLTRLTKKRN